MSSLAEGGGTEEGCREEVEEADVLLEAWNRIRYCACIVALSTDARLPPGPTRVPIGPAAEGNEEEEEAEENV